jgi:hypothetical protein
MEKAGTEQADKSRRVYQAQRHRDNRGGFSIAIVEMVKCVLNRDVLPKISAHVFVGQVRRNVRLVKARRQ